MHLSMNQGEIQDGNIGGLPYVILGRGNLTYMPDGIYAPETYLSESYYNTLAALTFFMGGQELRNNLLRRQGGFIPSPNAFIFTGGVTNTGRDTEAKEMKELFCSLYDNLQENDFPLTMPELFYEDQHVEPLKGSWDTPTNAIAVRKLLELHHQPNRIGLIGTKSHLGRADRIFRREGVEPIVLLETQNILNTLEVIPGVKELLTNYLNSETFKSSRKNDIFGTIISFLNIVTLNPHASSHITAYLRGRINDIDEFIDPVPLDEVLKRLQMRREAKQTKKNK